MYVVSLLLIFSKKHELDYNFCFLININHQAEYLNFQKCARKDFIKWHHLSDQSKIMETKDNPDYTIEREYYF